MTIKIRARLFLFLVLGMGTMAGTQAKALDCVYNEYTGAHNCRPMTSGQINRMTGTGYIDIMTGGVVGLAGNASSGMLGQSRIGTVSGTATIWNMGESSRIDTLRGGPVNQSVFVQTMRGNSSIGEIIGGIGNSSAGVHAMHDNASVGTVTGGQGNFSGFVNYMYGNSRIGSLTGGAGASSGLVDAMHDNSSIGTLTAGTGTSSGYVGVLGANAGSTAHIDLMRSGTVNIMDNQAYITRMENGTVNTMSGSSSITTMAGGIVGTMQDSSSVGALTGGRVTNMTGGTVVNMSGGEITNMTGTAAIVEPITGGSIGNISSSIGALVFGGSAQNRTGAHLFGNIAAGSDAFEVQNGGYVRIGSNSGSSSFARNLNVAGGLAELENVAFLGTADISDNGTVRLNTSNPAFTIAGLGFSGTGGLFDFGQGAYRSVTVTNFTPVASGAFALRTNYNTGAGDTLTINSSSGADSHTLRVTGNGSVLLAHADSILIANDLSNRLNFTLGNARDEVVLGNYIYALNNTSGSWELIRTDTQAEFKDAVNSVAGAHHGAVAMAHAVHGSLHQRLGELRFNSTDPWASMFFRRSLTAPDVGIWARGFGSYTSFEDETTFETTVYGVEVGLDGALYASRAENFIVGISGGYVGSRQDIEGIVSKGGESTGKAPFIGLYATYLNDYGAFLDLVGRYMRATTDAEFYDDADNKNEFSLSRNILMGSAEIGWQFVLPQRRHHFRRTMSFWTIEPRLQAVYTYLDKGNFTDDAGYTGDIEAAHSLLGIAGLSLGYNFRTSMYDMWRIYAKGAYIKEFDGKAEVFYNEKLFETDLSGNRFEAGGGIMGQITPDFAVYLDAAYQWGARSHSTILGNIGLRLSF